MFRDLSVFVKVKILENEFVEFPSIVINQVVESIAIAVEVVRRDVKVKDCHEKARKVVIVLRA